MAEQQPIVVRAGEGRTFDMPGERFTGKFAGAQTGGHIAIGEDVISPHHGTTLHRHMKSSEIFYIASGSILLELGDQEFTLQPGDFACAPPGCAHRMTNVSDTPATVVGMFAPAEPEAGLRALGELMRRTGGKPDPAELHAVRASGDLIEVGPRRTVESHRDDSA